MRRYRGVRILQRTIERLEADFAREDRGDPGAYRRSQIAQTTLRSILGKVSLAKVGGQPA
jgi:hypothetical protein